MYAFFVKKYNGKRYRMWATSFSNLCDALIKYEFLKKNSGYPRGQRSPAEDVRYQLSEMEVAW